jgi:hypothetical protein
MAQCVFDILLGYGWFTRKEQGYGFVSFKTVEAVNKGVSSIHNCRLILYDDAFAFNWIALF